MSKKNSNVYRERISQTLQRTPSSSVTSGFTELAGDLHEINISLIELRSQQPRRQFDVDALRHLQDSIKAQGVIQPIIVHRKEDGGFELVAGERRWRATKNVGLKTIPVRVISGHTDHQLSFIAAMENLQREDLNPVDEADAILNVLANELATPHSELPALLSRLRRVDRYRHNVMSSEGRVAEEDFETIDKVEVIFSQLAAGNWQSFVANKLGVLKLPEDLLGAVRRGEIPYTKATALRKIKNPAERAELLHLARDVSLEKLRGLISERAVLPLDRAVKLSVRLHNVAKQKRLETLPEKKRKRAVKLVAELERLLEED